MQNEETPNDPPLEASLPPDQVALYGSIIIGLARVYDVLLMMYSQTNPTGAVELRKMHSEGKMWCPPPSYTEDES